MILFPWRKAVIFGMGLVLFHGAVASATDPAAEMSHENEVENPSTPASEVRPEATGSTGAAGPTVESLFKDVAASAGDVKKKWDELKHAKNPVINQLLQRKTVDIVLDAFAGEEDSAPTTLHLVNQLALKEKLKATGDVNEDISARDAMRALTMGEGDDGKFDRRRLEAGAVDTPKGNSLYRDIYGEPALRKVVEAFQAKMKHGVSYYGAEGEERLGFRSQNQRFSISARDYASSEYPRNVERYNELVSRDSPLTPFLNREVGKLRAYFKSSGLTAIDNEGKSLPLNSIDSSGRFVFTKSVEKSTEVEVPEKLRPFLGDKLSGTETESFFYDGNTKKLVKRGSTIEFEPYEAGHLRAFGTRDEAPQKDGKFYVHDNKWYARIGHDGLEDVTVTGLPVDLSASPEGKQGFVLGADDLSSRTHVVMKRKFIYDRWHWKAEITPTVGGKSSE